MSLKWLRSDVLAALHDEQLAEHGGASGVRDEGLFDSALARAQNLAAYGSPSLFELAAAYTDGIARNHPFVDGNKRTAFIAAILFLDINGVIFEGNEVDAVERTLALAAGAIDAEAYAAWLEGASRKA